jgi:hypothetical protein
MSPLWNDRAHVADWYGRLQDRDAFRVAILDWDNARYIANMAEKGAREWPLVEEIIASVRASEVQHQLT